LLQSAFPRNRHRQYQGVQLGEDGAALLAGHPAVQH
jgi:hypothetical protein